jgi:dihydroorotate dehydrogenase electron transfer subunit
MNNLCQSAKFDAVYTCGPELMMSKVVQIATSKDMFVQASLERMMKCGVGICGSCCVNDDLVCKDGTIFDGNHLLSKSEFGHSHRTKAGILEAY